ncbi:MAG: ribonuclease P protein component [Deltaproteobacteria bacterium]
MRPQGFPKRLRLRRRFEYEALKAGARKLSQGSFLLVWRERANGPTLPTRLGIVASRKAGNAVARNAVKRWLREWFRKERDSLPTGLDVLIVVRTGAAAAGHVVATESLMALSRRLRSTASLRPPPAQGSP